MNIIGQCPGRAKEIILNGALNPLRAFLPTALIEQWCREANHSWRERVFGPVVTLTICTTLLDPNTYPAEELIQLYLRRWNIELDIRSIKVSLELKQLTAKSPDIVYKEIHSTLLAYNLVRATMAQTGLPVRSLSFERSRHLLLVFSERMVAAPTTRLPQLYRDLLMLISQATLVQQHRPPEPRCVIRRDTTYPVLHTSRQRWRAQYHAA